MIVDMMFEYLLAKAHFKSNVPVEESTRNPLLSEPFCRRNGQRSEASKSRPGSRMIILVPYFLLFSLFSHPLCFITYCSSWVVTKRLVVCQIFANARQEKRCSYCSEQGPITQVQTWFIWIGTDVFRMFSASGTVWNCITCLSFQWLQHVATANG